LGAENLERLGNRIWSLCGASSQRRGCRPLSHLRHRTREMGHPRKHGDHSLGAARERVRCLRMTSVGVLGLAEGGGEDWAHGPPDFATRRFWNANRFPWGNFGALHLGKGETYSGDFGESRGVRLGRWFPAGPESNLRRLSQRSKRCATQNEAHVEQPRQSAGAVQTGTERCLPNTLYVNPAVGDVQEDSLKVE
jgi:hypothetical protein